MAEIKNEYGGASIDKAITFSTIENYNETIRVTIQCDAAIAPHQTQQLAEVAESAKERIKKIVREW